MDVARPGFFDAWDTIDLGELRQRTVSFGLGIAWATIFALIIDPLRPILEPLEVKKH
jgi:hypothetical protein